MVIGINMMDVIRKRGDRIDMDMLSKELGCPVLPMSALHSDQTLDVAAVAVEAGKNGKAGTPHFFTGSVEQAIVQIEEAIKPYVDKKNLRWFAVKVFERDEKVLKMLDLPRKIMDKIEEAIKDSETELDDDAESIITNQRYEYIQNLVKRAVVKKKPANDLHYQIR